MVNYNEFSSWPCYGCKHANATNHFIPVYYCKRRGRYLKVKPKCSQREDDHPSNWHWYEEQHEAGRF